MEKLNKEYGASSLQVVMNYLQFSYTDDYGIPLETSEVIVPQQEGQFDLQLEVNGSDPNLLSIFKYNTQVRLYFLPHSKQC